MDTIEKLPESTQIFVDPIMADNGNLYSGIYGEHVEAMRRPSSKSCSSDLSKHYGSLLLLTETYAYPSGKSTIDYKLQPLKLALLGNFQTLLSLVALIK